jgi:ribose/xylose/arabinose/galactoside ABC-type transport system permease subunit
MRHTRSRSTVASSGRARIGSRPLEVVQKGGLLFALVTMVVVVAILQPQFVHFANLQAILLRISVMGIIAIPGAMLLMAGYVDLSVGSAAMLSAVVFGQAYKHSHSPAVATLCCLATGVLVGALNAELIARRGLSPVIVTLGGLAGFKGLGELLSGGQSQFGFGTTFDELGTRIVFDIPLPGLIFIAMFALSALYWYRSSLSQRVIAVGTDKDAARAMGIATKGLPAALYVGSGLTAAIGALIVTAQLDSASLSIGGGLELQVLTAILLGGVSFEGGRGSFLGVLTGLLFLGALYDGLIVLAVSPFWADAFTGIALALAAALDVAYRRFGILAAEANATAVGEAPAQAATEGVSAHAD